MRHLPRPGVLVAIAAVLLAGSVATAVIVTQLFPAIPVRNAKFNCETLTPSASSVPVGSSGFVTFLCTVNGQVVAAFEVPAGAILTPNFVLGPPWLALYVVPMGMQPSPDTHCGDSFAVATRLVSGETVSFPSDSATAWDYCADYADAPPGTLPSFDIAWEAGGEPVLPDRRIIITWDFPAPCSSFLESRHTGDPGSIEFWIYIEENNRYDLEGWAAHVATDGHREYFFTFDIGVASAPADGTQTGALQTHVKHPGLEWPADVEWLLFCGSGVAGATVRSHVSSPLQEPIVRFDFPPPCLSFVESRHTGTTNSIEFWIYIEESNSHDLEGWASHAVDGEFIFTFDFGVAQAPQSGTQAGGLQFFVTHSGLVWPADTGWQLFCR